jgi:hypothetical protein
VSRRDALRHAFKQPIGSPPHSSVPGIGLATLRDVPHHQAGRRFSRRPSQAIVVEPAQV